VKIDPEQNNSITNCFANGCPFETLPCGKQSCRALSAEPRKDIQKIATQVDDGICTTHARPIIENRQKVTRLQQRSIQNNRDLFAPGPA
jgi:hypothetical protein